MAEAEVGIGAGAEAEVEVGTDIVAEADIGAEADIVAGADIGAESESGDIAAAAGCNTGQWGYPDERQYEDGKGKRDEDGETNTGGSTGGRSFERDLGKVVGDVVKRTLPLMAPLSGTRLYIHIFWAGLWGVLLVWHLYVLVALSFVCMDIEPHRVLVEECL